MSHLVTHHVSENGKLKVKSVRVTGPQGCPCWHNSVTWASRRDVWVMQLGMRRGGNLLRTCVSRLSNRVGSATGCPGRRPVPWRLCVCLHSTLKGCLLPWDVPCGTPELRRKCLL